MAGPESQQETSQDMPTVKRLEERIARIEGFQVAFLHPGGGDVRGDRFLDASYPDDQRAASGSMTVSDWRRVRFASRFAGFEVAVLDAAGNPTHGRMLLATVRETYRESLTR